MLHDNLHSGKDTRDKLYAGIHKVAVAVGGTMGTGGSNAIIEAIETPGHLMTNDGYSIANSIVLADPIEEMGRKILVESINRANKASGDGSSTTCVLTDSIMCEGLKHLSEASPMDIKRSLEACLPVIESSIKGQTREVTVDDVGKVAAISAEDDDIGQTIQTIYKQIGKTGVIYWDISKTASDTFTVGTGITVEGAGYYSPYMCDANEAGQNTNAVRLNAPTVLITKQKISSASEFNELGQALYSKDIRDVVVFCDEVDPLVIPDIVKTRMVRGFRFILVKMPVLWKDEWYEDLALASGATVVDPTAGLRLKDVKMEHLGTFGHITITKDDTFIDGVKDLSEHIFALNGFNLDEATNRALRLNTKTARYFVGAHSDSALSYRRLKVEDAISAAWQALNGGIVAGGGIALLNTCEDMPDTIGGRILRSALAGPYSQIVTNAGGDPEAELPDDQAVGFDTRTKSVVNMFDAGIVDPTNVVLNAAKNAISVAATVLTANTVITFPQPDPVVSQGNTPILR